jgi:signal transduction histidine kinase
LVGVGTALMLGAGTYAHIYREEFEEVDLVLRGELDYLAGRAEGGDGVEANHPRIVFAVFDAEGGLRRLSPRLDEATARAALGADGKNLHAGVMEWRIRVKETSGGRVVAAYDLEEVRDVLAELLRLYAGLLPVVLVLALAGGRALASAALAPVRRLTSLAEQLQAADLSRRVDVPDTVDELQRLAKVFNDLIARLEGGFAQARRFSADASHELRTPLTILGAEIERLLHGREWPREQEASLVSMQEEIARLDRITEHLLLLASFDAGAARMRREPVDLRDMLREAAEDAELLGEALGVRVEVAEAESVVISGDAGHLRRLLLNLLQNAVRHNQPEGEVRCGLRREGSEAVVRVANTGPGISAEAHGRLFERFFRGEASRTGRESHGLGLALAREIARAHGGDVVLTTDTESVRAGWVEFAVRLPAAERGSP